MISIPSARALTVRRLTRVVTVVIALLLSLRAASAQSIGFVQANYAVPQTPQTTVNVPFSGAQTAGNLNVVVIGWDDSTSQVVSVTDARGNAYAQALPTTVQGGIQSQAIYYAPNILGAATNSVTVTFTAAASFPDVRIAEYSGIAAITPVNAARGSVGSGKASNSGAITTTVNSVLLVGANYVQKSTTAGGSGFTTRMITSPDGNILEDRIVSAAGSYSATATTTGGGWVMQIVAFRGAGGDTQAPTAPGSLSATAVSSNRIDLSWAAATDNVGVTGYQIERCQGSGCTNFAQVATASTLSYSDTTLASATSYSYRVRATDAAGNLGPYSNTAAATTLTSSDTQPPTAPGNLSATAASSTQINLAWTASTDNVGVTGYRVERCQGAGCSNFTEISVTASLSYNDNTLTASTSYTYRVRATDGANNLSAYSAAASATTLSSSQPVPISYVQSAYAVPQSPQSVVTLPFTNAQTAGSLNVVAIGWNDATSNVVSVTDSRGNVYAAAGPTTVQAGIQSHVIYYAPNIVAASTNSITVTFNTAVSYPDVRIAEYRGLDVAPLDGMAGASGTGTTSNSGPVTTTVANALLVGGNYVQTHTNTGDGTYTTRLITDPNGSILEDRIVSAVGTYSATATTSGGGWVMQVVAFRGATTGTSDTQAPTAPGSLSATPVSGSRIDLSWSASTDNVGVTGYRIERCQGAGCSNFAQVATATTPSYSDTSLTNATAYSYRVRATDGAGNLSAYSNVASATTLDTQAPSAPSSATAVASSSTQIAVSWTAATDNVGVTGYRVERCQGSTCTNFVEIATTAVTSYNDSNLLASSTYRYRIRAADAAGNLGPYSNIAQATTLSGPDTQAPTAPSGLSATPVSSTQINLAWTASTDNVGVTGYRIERCQGSGCSSFAEIAVTASLNYSDTLLTASSTYSYRLRATDAAANLSGYSATASATTQAGPKLSITQPAQGATITGGTVNVSYVVTGDLTEVNHVHFQLDSGSIVMDLTLDGSYQFTGVAAGSHVLNGVLVRADHSTIAGSDATPVNFTTVADTLAPTPPSGLSATAASSSQINLAWTASTDNVGVIGYRVERCQGAGCSNFAEIGVATTASYSDTSLSASTSYTYRVRAADAASNLSAYSATATATTLSTVPLVPISYVQSAYAVPQSPQSVVTIPFTSAQTAGSLNVVAIGWNDATSNVVSVTDASGNAYAAAGSTTVQPGIQSHVIYYASNIVAASTNSITVTFNTAVSYPDVRIAEYRGLDAAPLDGMAGASGTGTTSNSGPVTTTVANALLVGGNYVQTHTNTGDGTYTTRLITSPNGSILEDRILSAVGTYSATATTSGGGWVMQVVAFRGAIGGSSDTQAPTAPGTPTATVISSSRINLSWPAATDNVGVTGYRVERCQGASCSNFSQIAVATTTSYSDTSLQASTTYSYRVRATDGAANLGPYSPIATGTTLAPAPASISIILPADGSTIANTATFHADVTGAIVGIQFQVDNVNVGQPIVPTDSMFLDTTTFANGAHVVNAYGWDSQHNIFNAVPVSISFSNTTPGNPAQTGYWSPVFTSPLVSINLSLLGNGRVLMYDRMNSGNPDPYVWDPVTSSFLAVPTNDGANLFCSAQATLQDGRILVVGGHIADHVGLPTGHIFDPATNLWTSTPDMAVGRWYPTTTVLPNGKVLTLSGEVNGQGDYAQVPEVYDPATNTWAQLPLASLSIPYYPHSFVLPNGQVAVTGTAELAVPTRALDVTTQTWTTLSAQTFDAYTSSMYLPGKVLKSGKSTNSSGSDPSTATAYVIDMTVNNPRWRQVQSMAYPRAYHVSTILPDGSVLVTGGGTTTDAYGVSNAVYAAELWSPATETWTTMASAQKPRLYHGSAILLGDGRVLVSGGGRSPGPNPLDQENLEIFAPPYLFKGPRPSITTAPSQLVRNQAFTISTPDASRIAKVALIPVGNMTHGFNMSQRYLPLSFTVASGSSLTVTAPADSNLAPPGIYMLFIVDTLGVPSIASYTKF